MLTQKIIGTEYKKVKYHDHVKFLIFQCNNCHKNFSKMESYAKKQLKIHKNACCFCSPPCRDKYFRNLKKSKPQGNSHKKDTSLFGWLTNILRG